VCSGERGWLLPILALLALGTACARRGETAAVSVGAFAIPLRPRGSEPWRGTWGDELVPGMRALAVSPDLVARGVIRGTRVRIEGMPASYRVRHELGAEAHERVEIFMGTDTEAARRFGERRARIWWEVP
jgi:3D (Asp-Asp-Asp) domain-containing protein